MSAAALCGLAGTYLVYRSQERLALSDVNSAETAIGA
jgi:MHS family citrate/tricarballylate:H+ symporter-like MFS transporter